MSEFRLGLVGVGKIVRDQHLAAIEATPGIELVAVADPFSELAGMVRAAHKVVGALRSGDD